VSGKRYMQFMKTLKALLLFGVVGAFVMGPAQVRADGTNRPPVNLPAVVGDKNPNQLPAEIKTLLAAFETKRDAYQTAQKDLLAQLKNATTPEQREVIRAKLQDNRQAFLSEVRDFREELRQEIREMKNKINNEELNRLIGHGISSGDGRHHGK
jgi:hypothetical protein